VLPTLTSLAEAGKFVGFLGACIVLVVRRVRHKGHDKPLPDLAQRAIDHLPE
jgi:hypothetical protein